MTVTAEDIISNLLNLKNEALIKYGASPDYLVNFFMTKTKAKKTERQKVKKGLSIGKRKRQRMRKGARKVIETEEEIVIELDYEDHKTQISAAENLKAIIGLDAAKQIDLKHNLDDLGDLSDKELDEEIKNLQDMPEIPDDK